MEQGKAPSPEWLLPLLESKFFEQCERHLNQRKNEINRFCMECADSLCPNCVTEHFRKGEKHHFLQIRHYVHSDVVRVDDITKLLDITKIQQYIANGAKVVHLNPKTSKANPEGRFDDYDKEVLFNLEATGDDWDKPETGVKRCFTGKEESSSGTEKSDANCSFVTSHRKNNRKATPVRSPFN
ncbi:PLATZ transcription factor family protein [Rhynchospora pubera]|uniref:PLATZ transcription factor family protein n=1 Tax=Rhynchospora pubera TaxID=906938 RepID=A0AAV8DM06_9POAL|nr:PLATZ transcription factor family protein [Rhynchospora pubera]